MTDLILDNDFDLAVQKGDLQVGLSTEQHIALLVILGKAEIRQFPTRGVGARDYTLDEGNIGALNGAIKRELERDGMNVRAIRTQGEALQIDATYE